MKTKMSFQEKIILLIITICSFGLNFINIGIEGTANSYYAAAAKSMTMSLKNFFFVSFDPTGFVTIDKPPVGFWLQAISAKIFGFSGWSILLPQALAGAISVAILFLIVRRSFGNIAGYISSIFLTITPVFVAASRNNTMDNTLVMVLLVACWFLLKSTENGKIKYLYISMIMVGIGFNVKMLQAYLVLPAIYITYLLSTSVTIKKRLIHLTISTVVLIFVSLSWAIVVDLIPTSERPYIDSSTDNSVMELIIGHNGLERLNLLSNSKGGRGGMGHSPNGMGQPPNDGQFRNYMGQQNYNQNENESNGKESNVRSKIRSANSDSNNNQINDNHNNQDFMGGQFPDGNFDGNMPNGGPGGMGGSRLQGSFGAEVTAGVHRLFLKSILSDQIVWFIVLALFGFIAGFIKEKIRIKLDNDRKQSLILWFMWFLPAFIYFSFNTGTWHAYYLTMLAPPAAALSGIGIVEMWSLYKEKGIKSWILPIGLILTGAVHLMMLSYFIDYSSIIYALIVLVSILVILTSIILFILCFKKSKNVEIDNEEIYIEDNKYLKIKKVLLTLSIVGLTLTPFVGSSAAIYNSVGSLPAAGLELLQSKGNDKFDMGNHGGFEKNSSNNGLVQYLIKNKGENQKYLLVVSSSSDGAQIIIDTDESVMSLGGFLGNNNPLTLEQFKELVKKGEVRYIMTGGGRGNSNNEIMSWAQQVGKAISSSEYSNATNSIKVDTSSNNQIDNNTQSNDKDKGIRNSIDEQNNMNKGQQGNMRGFGMGQGTLYDLKGVVE